MIIDYFYCRFIIIYLLTVLIVETINIDNNDDLDIMACD